MEGTARHWCSTISDPTDPGLAHGHKVKSSSWEKLSKAFYTSSGVRQGCVLAPALFCLAIDWIMSRCSGSLGITLDGAVFTDLDYTDDAVIFAQDPGRWQAELKRFDNTANTMGLHTSWEKTKLQNTPPQSVSVDGHPVEVTNKFVYLGSTVDSSGYFNTDILRRIGLASSVMGQLDLSLIHI